MSLSLTWRILAIAALSLLALAGWSAWNLMRPDPARSLALAATLPDDPVERGRLLFAHGDLGVLDLDTLETTALPWAVLTAALALDAAEGDPAKVAPALVEARLREVGFLFPAAEAGRLPMQPLGLNLGRVGRAMPPLGVMTANLGCAACHAGVSYDAAGNPDPSRPVPGAPNTSLDLEAYTQTVYRALTRAFADEAALWAAVDALHPTMGWRERLSLRFLVLPRARARMADIAAAGGRPLPFPNGRPGLTNGVAALKQRFGRAASPADAVGFVSVPDLADRAFRTSFLADGAYAPPGGERFAPRTAQQAAAADPATLARIGSFFTVPSMGMTPERAEAAIPDFVDIVRYLATYRAPAFPGPVSRERLPLGRAVYARACAHCHGSYDDNLDAPRLESFPNRAGDVGTDMGRARAFDSGLAAAVAGSRYAAHIEAQATGMLVAPLLSGVWASAPYFVNGSVPTLRHLLEPGTRPERFLLGGHRLDMDKVGVALEPGADGLWRYPAGYEPFSTPVEIDTRQPGFSNRGHEAEVEGLSADERDALLDYLKLL